MSTILKALRRLEEDKRAQAARSLEHAVLEPVQPAGRGGLGVGIGLGVAAVLGVLAIGWALSSIVLSKSTGAPPLAHEAPALVREVPPFVREAPLLANEAPLLAKEVLPLVKEVAPQVDELPQLARRAPIPLPAASMQERYEATRALVAKESPEPLAATEPAAVSAAVVAPSSAPPPVAAKQETVVARTAKPAPKLKAAPIAAPVPAPVRVPAPAPPSVAAAPEAKPSPALAQNSAPPSRDPGAMSVLDAKPSAISATPPARVKKSSLTPLERAVAAEAGSTPGGIPQVQQIVWHPSSARRVAVLSVDGAAPQRIGEGGTIAGYTIAKIGVSKVEFVRDGVTTKRGLGGN